MSLILYVTEYTVVNSQRVTVNLYMKRASKNQ